MPSQPPDGFEELGEVVSKAQESSFSAIGVVTDFLPACRTRGTDYIATFSLTDYSWLEGQGLKCRFFGKTEQTTPKISSIGDVVVLRSVRLKRYRGDLLGLSSRNSSWIIFHQHEIATSEIDTGTAIPFSKMTDQIPAPNEQIVRYAVALCNFQDRTGLSKPPPATSLQVGALLSSTGSPPPSSASKFQLVQDLAPPRRKGVLKFTDLLGEVRKVYMNDFRVEMTISDYTSNEALYHYAHASEDNIGRDGDDFNYTHNHSSWRGPWGKMSMVVTAWDAHARFAREHVGQNSLVFLHNVQICLDREGDKMEGNLRGDRYHPEKIGISVSKPQYAKEDERVKALLRRKRDYEAELKLHGIKGLAEFRRHKDEAAQQEEATPKFSSKEKNRRRREKKAQAKRNDAAAAGAAEFPADSKFTSSTLQPKVRINKVPTTVTPVKISEITDPATLNNSFNTSNGNPITLPFKNNLYHLKPIRCLDFNPPDIADFAAPHKTSEYEVLSDYESTATSSDIDMIDTGGAEVTWEWRFELLVEDANSSDRSSTPPSKHEGGKQPAAAASRIKVLVAGSDADFLLRNIRATDLRSDLHALTRLKEKLFLLWGSLQESKEEERNDAKEQQQPHANPFECLVREYGVQLQDGTWERVFAMFGTSIVS